MQESVGAICTELIEVANLYVSECSQSKRSTELAALQKRAALGIMRAKAMNRTIHTSLDKQRSAIEARKDHVDRLHLKLENLLYKRAYLLREIRACKDLSTPMLTTVEQEMQTILTVTEYTVDLPEQHQKAIATLNKEKQLRIDAKASIESRLALHQSKLDVVDGKRKFLEEIPSRVQKIEGVLGELLQQFTASASQES